MPRIYTTSKTYLTLEYTYDRKELLACLGIETKPGDQVQVNYTNQESLKIKIVSIDESSS